ncbi:MAG: hypothetical protein K6E11_02955 [Bacilli bacterium]|nr:hypothetical protein [Bacilli bacterium]
MEAVASSPRRINVLLKQWHIILLTCIVIPVLTYISPILSIIVTYSVGFYLLFKSNFKFLIFFLCFIFVQNITLILCAEKFTETTNTIFTLSKEIMLYIFVIKNMFVKRKGWNHQLHKVLSIAFLLLLTFSFFVSDAEFYSKVLAIRQLLLPFVCFYFGYYLDLSPRQKRSFFDLVITFGIIVCFFGLIEIFFLKDTIWVTLPIAKYQENKGVAFDLYHGVPLNFYTWDYVELTGKIVRRLVSTFADPLTTGHFLFICFAVTRFSNSRHKKLLSLLFFVVSLMTLSKGIYLSYIIYFIYYVFKNIKFKTFKILFFILLGLALIAFPIVLLIANRFFPNSSLLIHIDGFIKGVFGSSFFGAGIGKAGVMLSAKTNIDRLTGESFIGVLTSQIGYIGFAIFALFVIYIIFIMFHRYSITKDRLVLMPIILLSAVFVENFFSESSVAIVSTGLFFILVGNGVCSISRKRE